MNFDRVELIDARALCRGESETCRKNISPFVTSDMKSLVKLFSDFEGSVLMSDEITAGEDTGHDGLWLDIFNEERDDATANQTEIEEDVSDELRLISLIGSCSSLIILLAVFVTSMVKKDVKISKARRIQLGMVAAKMLFFLFFCCGRAFRFYQLACRILAILTHYSMLVSFAHMMWFSGQVAWVSWRVNHNLASLALENRDGKMGVGEKVIFALVWIGMLSLVIILGVVDAFVLEDRSFISYGNDQFCLLTGKLGRLIFIVAPTTAMILFDFGCLVSSVYQLCQASESPLDKKRMIFYLKFCFRMMVFQSLQWVFGVFFHFLGFRGLRDVFEVLVAYEGVFMGLFFIVGKTR